MSKSRILLSVVVAGMMTLGLSGCGRSSEGPSAPEATTPSASDDDHAEHQHGHDMPADEYEAQLAKLSPEDRALAEKQKVCPVSGDPLGSMGVPYKVTVEGREVMLCCSGCEKAIKEDPEKYLAKLPE